MIKFLFILPFLLGQTSGFTVSFLNISSADTSAVPILDNNGNPIALGSGFVRSLHLEKETVPFRTILVPMDSLTVSVRLQFQWELQTRLSTSPSTL